jgi:hypothetical protein
MKKGCAYIFYPFYFKKEKKIQQDGIKVSNVNLYMTRRETLEKERGAKI